MEPASDRGGVKREDEVMQTVFLAEVHGDTKARGAAVMATWKQERPEC